MATQTPWAPNLTRPHWGGADSDQDIHLEIYESGVDTRFQATSIFTSLSMQRSVQDKSNTLRIDRLGTSSVKGRRSGEKLEATRVPNDKMLIVVDTVLYIRNPIDWQDDWTGPDFLNQMAQNNGSEFAEAFDQAHAIQAIKARDWKAPEHLKPGFKDGMLVKCAVKGDASTQAELEANAININAAHAAGVNELIKRKVPLNDMITLIDPVYYAYLLEHPKLMNVQFGQTNSDGYKQRRVVTMNGIPVVEFTEFPQDAISDHPLGTAFNVTAEDAKCKMITFSKSKSLVTVEAKPFTSSKWPDPENFCDVLDCYAMYTVEPRRPDTIVVTQFTEAGA